MSIKTLRELKTVARGSPIRRRIRIAGFPCQNEFFIVVINELLSLGIALINRLRRSLIIDVCLTFCRAGFGSLFPPLETKSLSPHPAALDQSSASIIQHYRLFDIWFQLLCPSFCPPAHFATLSFSPFCLCLFLFSIMLLCSEKLNTNEYKKRVGKEHSALYIMLSPRARADSHMTS